MKVEPDECYAALRSVQTKSDDLLLAINLGNASIKYTTEYSKMNMLFLVTPIKYNEATIFVWNLIVDS